MIPIKIFIILILLFVIAIFLFYTKLNKKINRNLFTNEKSVEALQWLETNKNPHAFAGNRFNETKDAIKFVEKLYEVGAKEVRVTGIYDEKERIENEGGGYAETLIVQLPEETSKRAELFGIYRYELKNYDFNSGEDLDDEGQTLIEFWWD